MKLNIQPVIFGGLEWGHPDTARREWKARVLADKQRMYEEKLTDVEMLDVCMINCEDEVGKWTALASNADMVLVLHTELLSVTWAAKALATVDVPVVLHGQENYPTPCFVDLYGYLRADGHDVHLALDIGEARSILRVLEAKKRLASTKILLIGEGFPSWSQVANPTSPELVEEKLGIEIRQRGINELLREFEAANTDDASTLAKEWLDGAEAVTEEAKRDIVDVAKVYSAIKKMLNSARANAFTIDCRAWDELTMEKFGRFFSPCMSLTTLRWEGIPAACEADICALLAQCVLTYLSGLPAFLGNIGQVNPTEGWVAIEHAAAAANMDGTHDKLEGYTLTDYQRRGTGVASYCSVEEGQDITFARFDKNLNNISVAVGKSLATERCFRVVIGDISDFMHRCLVGDHHAVIYGNHLKEVAALAEMLGVGILTPNCQPQT